MQKGQVIEDPEIEDKWPFVAYLLVAAKLMVRREGSRSEQ